MMVAEAITPSVIALAARGWHVFPLHWVEDGVCSCGGSEKCKPGKHPLTPHGHKDASTDRSTILTWAKRWPRANWAVATGAISGLFVVDVDPRNGGRVPDDLPDTLMVQTGGGGLHLYFTYPKNCEGPWRKGLDTGVDIQADGKYLVVPPSRTAGEYRFLNDLPLAPAPEWIVESVRKDREEITLPPSAPVDLDAVRRRLRLIRKPEARELARRLLEGESLAEPGDRDNALWVATGLVAWAAPGMDPVSLGELFDANCRLWSDNDPGKYTAERVKAHEKIERQQAALSQKAREQANVSIRTARANGGGQGTYSNEEIARFAEQQKCTVEEFGARWIIQVKGAYYPYCNGGYRAPAVDVDFMSRIRQDLAPAPIGLTRLSKDGATVPKNKEEILREFSTAVPHTIADYTRDVSHCDPAAGIFYEAVRPKRVFEPEYNPEIDRWIRYLGAEHGDKLLDWLATSTDLSRPTALLYFSGASSAGKSLFADGMARLWTTDGVTKMGDIFGAFNDALTSCPVIFADEKLPPGVDTAWLREQVTVFERALSRKFLDKAKLRGCLRFVCASNPDDMLAQGDESFTQDSLAAIGERVLHFPVTQTTSEYLRSIGGYETTKDWTFGDAFPRYVTWLRANRAVTPGSRLLVAGVPGAVHRALATQSLHGGLILQLLARHLRSGGKTLNRRGLVVGGGKYLVTADAIEELWETYVKSHKVPSAKKIGGALRGFADKVSHKQRYWWSVDIDTLCSWEDHNGSMDTDEMRAIVARVPEAI